MSTPTITPPPEPPDPGPLPDGAPCYGCRYNLVGRSLDEQCPECGMDVAPSWPVTERAVGHAIHLKQLRLEFLWLNALALLAAISTISLAASALVHVTSRNATAWQSVSFTMLVVGLAGWYAAYAPLLAIAMNRVHKHPNGHHMAGAWSRWHMYVGTTLAAFGFLGCLIAAPIAYAVSQHAGIWTAGICFSLLLTGALIQLLGSWTYAGSILRRAKPGPQCVHDRRHLWMPPAAVGMVVAIATCVGFANDTIVAILLPLWALAGVLLAQRLLRALVAIRRAEKAVRQPATPG